MRRWPAAGGDELSRVDGPLPDPSDEPSPGPQPSESPGAKPVTPAGGSHAPAPWDPATLTGIPSDPPIPIDAGRTDPPRRLVRGARRLAHLVGRRLLVGITMQDAGGEVISRDQFCGQVTEVVDGVVVVDRKGTQVVLPADEAAYEVAAPGTYRLADTEEEVVDPDYVTSWTLLQRPAGRPPTAPPMV